MRKKWLALVSVIIIVGAGAGLAVYPVQYTSPEELFEIPQGTWAQRMSGNPVSILPDHIFLTVGVRNVLVLKNLDDVPQMFGPTLIMPGQSFSLPFDSPGEYNFACTAHASGQMMVQVDPEPAVGWLRLRWRVNKGVRWLSDQFQ